MESNDPAARLVLITAPDLEVARALGRRFVEAHLAACVNLVPGVTSIYRWQGELCEEGEVLLVVKTTAAALAGLEAENARAHPYDCPEFVALDPAHVAPGYLAWLAAAVT